MKLQAGSLAGQVEQNKKEFRQYVEFMNKFMQQTQQHFRDVQSAFADAMYNHELRIKELEKLAGILPKQELKGELENLIEDSAEPVTDTDTQLVDGSGEPVVDEIKPEASVETESKVKYHKEF